MLVELCFSQPLLTKTTIIGVSDGKRQQVQVTAQSQLHVREATGNNDGVDVVKYLNGVGLGAGQPWCCAFVVWVFTENNINIPKTGYCPTLFTDKSKVVYKKNIKTIKDFQYRKSQVFGLYFESKKRVAHVGILTGQTLLNYQTIEGNTNTEGSREGDGVYKRIRNKRSITLSAIS